MRYKKLREIAIGICFGSARSGSVLRVARNDAKTPDREIRPCACRLSPHVTPYPSGVPAVKKFIDKFINTRTST